VNRLTIQIEDADRNYERSITIAGAERRDAADWKYCVWNGLPARCDSSRPPVDWSVPSTSRRSRFHFYRITINNLGKAPLHVTGARLFDRVETRAERRRQEARIVSSDHDFKNKADPCHF